MNAASELQLDPDAPAPKMTGVYERGPDAIPVLWG